MKMELFVYLESHSVGFSFEDDNYYKIVKLSKLDLEVIENFETQIEVVVNL